jgi:hypothetical protein
MENEGCSPALIHATGSPTNHLQIDPYALCAVYKRKEGKTFPLITYLLKITSIFSMKESPFQEGESSSITRDNHSIL